MSAYSNLVMMADTSQLKKAKEDLRGIVTQGSQTEKAVNKVSESFDDVGKSTTRAGDAIKRTTAATERAGGAFKGTSRELSTMNGLAVKAAGSMAAFGAAILSAQTAARAITSAREMNAALAETSTLIQGTPEQMRELSSAANKLVADFGGNAADKVKGFYQAISAGASSVAEANTILETANKLAIGGVTEVTTSVDILTSATNVYKKEGLSAAAASDALFVAMKAGKTTIGQLASSLGAVLPLSQNLGVSFDETAASVAALTKGGIATSEAVTGLRAAMTAVLGPSKEATTLAAKLGINFNAASLQAKGFSAFMADVVAKTGGSSEAMQTLFSSVEATTVALSMAGQGGKFLNEIMVDMGRKSGATTEAYNKMAASLDQRLSRATAALNALLLTVGNVLLTVIVPALEFAAAATTMLANNSDLLWTTLSAIAVLQATRFIPMMVASAASVTSLEMSMVAALVSARALSLAMAVTPVGAIVAAVTAFGYLVKASRSASDATNIQKKAETELATALKAVDTTTRDGIAPAKQLAQARLNAATAAVTAAKAELELWDARMASQVNSNDLEGTSFATSVSEGLYQKLRASQSALAGVLAAIKDARIEIDGVSEAAATLPADFKLSEERTAAIAVNLGKQYEYLGNSRRESDAALATAMDQLRTIEQQNDLARVSLAYGQDSLRATEAKQAAELEVLRVQTESLDVAQDVKDRIIAAAQAGYDLANAASIASGQISTAAGEAARLATNLGAAAASASTSADKQLTVVRGQLKAIKDGQDSIIVGKQLSLAYDKEALRNAQMSAGVDSSIANAIADKTFASREALISAEAELASAQKLEAALNKTGSAGKKAGAATTAAMKAAEKAAKASAREAAKAAKEIDDARQKTLADLDQFVSNGMDSFINELTTGFAGGMKAINKIFTDTLKGLISYALKNKILIGVGASTSATGAAADAVGGAAAGSSSGLIGMISQFSGVGASLLSGASGLFTALTGAGGGLASAGTYLSAVLGTATTSVGAFAAAVGAVAPIALAAYTAFKFFQSTTKINGVDLSATVGGDAGATAEMQTRKTKSKYFGLSKKKSTSVAAADSGFVSALSDSALQIQDVMVGLSSSLGLSSEAMTAYERTFKIGLKGLTDEQQQAAIEKELKNYANDLAIIAMGSAEYVKAGESFSGTLQRLVSDMSSVNPVMDTLGNSFRATGIQGADAASKLIEAFGGLDAFSSATSKYYDLFYSEEERLATTTRQTTEAVNALGLAMPKTREQYRQMIDSMDLNTEYGRTMYATLVSLAEAMDKVIPVAQALSDVLTGIVSVVTTDVDSLISGIQSLASDAKSAANAWYDTAKSLREFLKDLTNSDLSATSAINRLIINQEEFSNLMAGLRAGDLSSAQKITGAASDLLASVKATSGTAFEFAKAEAAVRRDLRFAAGVSDLQGANSDVTVTLYEAQLELLKELKTYLADGSITAENLSEFSGALADLQSVIEQTDMFSYDYLQKQMQVTVDLVASAAIPDDMKALLKAGADGIKSTIDFAVSADDLTPDLRWLAVNSASEHIKTVQYLANNKLGSNLTKLAIANVASLLKTIDFVVGSDIDATSKRLALTSSNSIATTVTALLAKNSDPDALAIALSNTNDVTVSVLATLNPATSAGVRQLVLNNTATYTASILAAFDPALSASARRVLLTQQGQFIANITGIVVSSAPAAIKSLLLNANTTAMRSITIAAVYASTLTAADKALLLSTGNSIRQTITQMVNPANLTANDLLFFSMVESGNVSITKRIDGKFSAAALTPWATAFIGMGNTAITKSVTAKFNALALSPTAWSYINALDSSITKTLAAQFNGSGMTPVAWSFYNSGNKSVLKTVVGKLDASSITPSGWTFIGKPASSVMKIINGGFNGSGITPTAWSFINKASSVVTKTITGLYIAPTITAMDTRLLNMQSVSVNKTILGSIDTSGLTPEQKFFLSAISGATAGKIVLGGSFVFNPSTGFSTLFSNQTTSLTTLNPSITSLITSLNNLGNTIINENKKQAYVQSLISAAQGVMASRNDLIQTQRETISNIRTLESNTGIQLVNAAGGAANVSLDAANGSLTYDATQVAGDMSNIGWWQKNYWNKGGLQEQLWTQSSAVNQSNQQLQQLRDSLTAQGILPAFASGGMHSGGLRLVGENGPEVEATGPSRIYSADQTKRMLTGGARQSVDLTPLLKEIQALREENRQLGLALELQTRKTAKVLAKWDTDGTPAERIA